MREIYLDNKTVIEVNGLEKKREQNHSHNCILDIETLHPFQLPVQQKDKKRLLFRFGRKKSNYNNLQRVKKVKV